MLSSLSRLSQDDAPLQVQQGVSAMESVALHTGQGQHTVMIMAGL